MQSYRELRNVSVSVMRNDIILLQEIRDKDESSIWALLADIDNVQQQYQMELSARLGRTSSKEQYALLYKSDKIEVQKPQKSNYFCRKFFEKHP